MVRNRGLEPPSASYFNTLYCICVNHHHGRVEMFPALFSGEFAGQLAGLGGQTTAGSFFRVIELRSRGSLRLSHSGLNMPLPEGVVNW